MITITDISDIDAKNHRASIEFEIKFSNLDSESLIKLGAAINMISTNFKIVSEGRIILDYGYASGTLYIRALDAATKKIRKLIDQLFFYNLKSELQISLNSHAEINPDFENSGLNHDRS